MFRVFNINHHQGIGSYLIKLLLVYICFRSMLAACHIVRVMGLDFLLLVLPCTGFLYLKNFERIEILPSSKLIFISDILKCYFQMILHC